MLEGTKVEFVKKRCPRHIIKPINTVVINEPLEYSSYVGGILTSQKIVDNINDESGAKRILAQVLRLIFSKMHTLTLLKTEFLSLISVANINSKIY
jgi:hypothetical protein